MPREAARVPFQARLTIAFLALSSAFPVVVAAAAAVPSHRAAGVPRATFERQPAVRPTQPNAAHRPEAERSPSPTLWNPLKRRRMAMPAPPAIDGSYAF